MFGLDEQRDLPFLVSGVRVLLRPFGVDVKCTNERVSNEVVGNRYGEFTR